MAKLTSIHQLRQLVDMHFAKALVLGFPPPPDLCQTKTHIVMKCHFHAVYWRKTPASMAPTHAPSGGEAANAAKVRFRALPGGTKIVKVATALGMSIPPPIPVRARATMNEV